jgi:integrase/recombinase XerD
MFDLLFQRSRALARHQNGPLAEERRRYLSHRADQGMAHNSLRCIASHLLASIQYLRLADRPCETILYAEIEEKANLWAKRLPRPPKLKRRHYARAQFLRYASSWLQFLGRLQLPTTPPGPFAGQIAAFAEFLSHEKGLAPSTIKDRCSAVRQFLGRLGQKKGSLRRISLPQIDQALVELVTQGSYARTTVQLLASHLRSFFRYAEVNDWCCPGLADGIKAPRVFAQEGLPVGPSWDDVRRLLATAEGDRPNDVRDRALLMLLAIYGLRACEVRSLRLEDFDWRNEVLSVRRSKTRSAQTYPLSGSVGDAVLHYLKRVRPRSAYKEVFLSCLPPFGPLSSDGVAAVVCRRLRTLGVSLPHYGSHVLRHACATHLLERGLSLKEIGDHLGHHAPDSTRIYAKVDLSGLRQVADFDLGDLQ